MPEAFWRQYEKFISNTATKTVLANLTAADLQAIDWHNNADAEHSFFVNGKEYYLAEVRALLPLDGLSELVLWER
jgi:hypothetical protein